jgi:hypothetical protein
MVRSVGVLGVPAKGVRPLQALSRSMNRSASPLWMHQRRGRDGGSVPFFSNHAATATGASAQNTTAFQAAIDVCEAVARMAASTYIRTYKFEKSAESAAFGCPYNSVERSSDGGLLTTNVRAASVNPCSQRIDLARKVMPEAIGMQRRRSHSLVIDRRDLRKKIRTNCSNELLLKSFNVDLQHVDGSLAIDYLAKDAVDLATANGDQLAKVVADASIASSWLSPERSVSVVESNRHFLNIESARIKVGEVDPETGDICGVGFEAVHAARGVSA